MNTAKSLGALFHFNLRKNVLEHLTLLAQQATSMTG